MSEEAFSQSRDKRESVMMRATVWIAGAKSPTEHRVRNLSLSGACIANPEGLRAGATIRVSIGQAADLDAIVMWVRQDAAGIRFEVPIDLAAARRTQAGKVTAQAGWMSNMYDAYRR